MGRLWVEYDERAGPTVWPLRPLCGPSKFARSLRSFLPPLVSIVLTAGILRSLDGGAVFRFTVPAGTPSFL